TPPFGIVASSFSFSGVLPPNDTSSISAQAVIGALAYCRLSGVYVSGTGFVLPTTGDTHGSTTIDNLVSVTGVEIGNTVIASDAKPQTTVTSVKPSPCCSVTL